MLRLAGQILDEEVALARKLLADGREDEVARVIRKATAPGYITLPEPDHARLMGLLSAAGVMDADDLVGIRENPGTPRFRYSAGGPNFPLDSGDAQEQAVIEAARQCGVRELYVVWRYPPVALMDTRRIFLAKADAGADLVGITGRLQEALVQAGDLVPQVEVYSGDAQLSGYQREAYRGSATLWLDGDPSQVQFADTFDGYGPEGAPFFASDHPRISDPSERELLLRYLQSGAVLEPGSRQQDDIADPSLQATVPDGLRSDGQWIWSEAASYYLEHYSLAPEPALCEHILSRNGQPREPSEAELRNAQAFLLE